VRECRELQFLNLVVLITSIIDVNGLDISGVRSFTFTHTYTMMIKSSSYTMMIKCSSYTMIIKCSSYTMMIKCSSYTMIIKCSSYTMIIKFSSTNPNLRPC
jgi:hypothetical protein